MFDRDYYDTLADGEEKMTYLKKEIAEADARKDIKDMIYLRHRYIDQSVFHGDSFKGLLMFPEYMKLVDEHPDDANIRSFMFAFKWIVENSQEFYQIPMEQALGYFESFKEHIGRYGYTLRSYYYKLSQFYRYIDPAKAVKYLSQFSRYERTEMSDCQACEAGYQAEMELEHGSPAKAVAMLNEMIQRNMRCAEVPQVTYAFFSNTFARMGCYEEAEHYASLCLPMIKDDLTNYTVELSEIIELKTVTDINAAYELICESLHLFSGLKNPFYRFTYAEAAWRFFDRYLQGGNDPVIPMRLSAEFEKYSEEGRYDAGELRDWFYGIASDLAEKFDTRGGTDYCRKHLAFVYPEGPSQELKLPMHGSSAPGMLAFGVPVLSDADFPDVGKIYEMLNTGGRFDEVMMFKGSENEQDIIIKAKKQKADSYELQLMLRDPVDASEFRQIHYLPEGFEEKIQQSDACFILTASGGRSNHERLKLLIDLTAQFPCTAGAVYDLVNSRILSAEWIRQEASGESLPYDSYLYRVWIYGAAREGCYDLLTGGLDGCGQRELFIPAVPEDVVETARKLMIQAANYAVNASGLPDEDVDFNCGIVYADKGFCRIKWEPLESPVEDDDRYFALPLIKLPGREEFCGITELSPEDRAALSFRSSGRADFNDEKKHREHFERAMEIFRSRAEKCRLYAGYEVPYTDGDGEDLEAYPYLMLSPDGSGEVVNRDIPELGLRVGDRTRQPAERVYTWKIVQGEEEYYADELYLIEAMLDKEE